MNQLGLALLLLSFVGGAMALALALASIRRGGRDEGLLGASRRWVNVSAAAILAASAVLLHLLVNHDFSNEYVAGYTDRRMALLYLMAAFWGGQKGSLLFWALNLIGAAALALHLQRYRRWAGEAWAIVFLMAIFLFFGTCLLFVADPFEQFLVLRLADGDGLNPLLQNAAMVYHPPTILAGYAIWAIPFAYSLAGLAVGDLEAGWQRSLRAFTVGGWVLLSLGNLFGAFWAYTELGWGGFWGWDPVENASLMPWFTATAYIHSIMVQERRGMAKGWNMALLMVTFMLTLLGTFITRTGLIQSVHAFGSGSLLGPMFLVLMVLVVVVWSVLMVVRRGLLQGRVPSGRLTLLGFFLVLQLFACWELARGSMVRG
ncbi:MAG: heme lyase CcmF/NrfE family subunit, partial [Deltaproteobacteria bacterium]|nr:heme lyase CcmF/NrfE family subunit [Deltaproteobacteria bacterium]